MLIGERLLQCRLDIGPARYDAVALQDNVDLRVDGTSGPIILYGLSIVPETLFGITATEEHDGILGIHLECFVPILDGSLELAPQQSGIGAIIKGGRHVRFERHAPVTKWHGNTGLTGDREIIA